MTTQLVERLHVLAERYVRKHLEPEDRQARADSEHRAILKAWLARDAARITALVSQHSAATLDDLRRQLHGNEATRESVPARVRGSRVARHLPSPSGIAPRA